jgi:4-hydroxybenzoate polyprenyltransferase
MNWAGNNNVLEYSLFMPIMMLSLFVLSALAMAYFLLYQPVMLYIEDKKKEAVRLFVKTLIIFAIMPFGIFLLYFFNILS